MPNEILYDAGVFVLTAEGWILAKRKVFADRVEAMPWVKRNAAATARKYRSQRVRGSIVEAKGSWLTLEWVLADYEKKRLANDPEFNELETKLVADGGVTASYTALQGQYLAFIQSYTKLNGRPPAEADMQRYFKTTPPTIHQMVVMLERKRLISRTPGEARSIRVLLPREQLPALE